MADVTKCPDEPVAKPVNGPPLKPRDWSRSPATHQPFARAAEQVKTQNTQMPARVHTPGVAGVDVDAKKTAVVFIEYQNEFTTEGGKLHDAVKGTMGSMLSTSADLAEAARAAGATVMHAPICFKEDASDNPNKGVGILAGCAGDKLFTEGTRKLGVGFGLGRLQSP